MSSRLEGAAGPQHGRIGPLNGQSGAITVAHDGSVGALPRRSRSPSNRPPASASIRRCRRGCPDRVVVGRPARDPAGPGPFSFRAPQPRATSSGRRKGGRRRSARRSRRPAHAPRATSRQYRARAAACARCSGATAGRVLRSRLATTATRSRARGPAARRIGIEQLVARHVQGGHVPAGRGAPAPARAPPRSRALVARASMKSRNAHRIAAYAARRIHSARGRGALAVEPPGERSSRRPRRPARAEEVLVDAHAVDGDRFLLLRASARRSSRRERA